MAGEKEETRRSCFEPIRIGHIGSADYSRSACAVFAANLENIDKLDSQRDANRFVFWNSLDMNGQLLLKFYWLLYFVEPGSFDSSTEGCFCEVSSSTVAGLFRWC